MVLRSLPTNKLHGTCVENDYNLNELKPLRPAVSYMDFSQIKAAQLEKLDKYTK